VGGGFGRVGGAGADVELGGFGHAVAEGGDFFVGGGGEVLGGEVVSECGGVMGRKVGRPTMPSARRRRLVGFLSAASMALSRARLRPVAFLD